MPINEKMNCFLKFIKSVPTELYEVLKIIINPIEINIKTETSNALSIFPKKFRFILSLN